MLDTTPNAIVPRHEAFRMQVDLKYITYSSRIGALIKEP